MSRSTTIEFVGAGSRLQARCGESPGLLDLPTFAVGDLFVLVLDRPDFREARLRTHDGHSFYAVFMAFGAVHLTLADVGSAGMDYEGY